MKTGRHEAQCETKKYRAGFRNLEMDDNAVRGTIFCDIKQTETPELEESDVKISKQNLKSFLNTVKEIEEIEEDLKEEIYKELYKLKSQEAKKKALKNTSEAEHQEEPEDLDIEEKQVEQVLEKGYLPEVLQETDNAHVGDYILKATATLSALSKNLTDMPINLWSIGGSGAGKTHCFKTIFKTLPKERKIKFNSCSPKALYYFTKDRDADVLDGKVLLFNEAEASEEAVEVLRSVTDPDEEDMNLSTVMDQESLTITIQGSPITWFTSVDPLEDSELQNRFLFSNPNEGTDQKDRIADHQFKKFQKGELQPIKNIDYSHLKACYRKIVEETKDLNVLIPFEWEWNRKSNPRLQQYFTNVLFCITKTYYRNRPVVDGNIVATLTDYYIAKSIWDQIEAVTRDRVKEKDLKLLEHIPLKQPDNKEDIEEDYVTRSDLQEETGRTYNQVRHATKKLQNAGLIRGVKAGDSDNAPWHYYEPEEGVASPAIELKKESLEVKSIENTLESFGLPVSEIGDTEGVRSRVTHLTPLEMLGFYASTEIDFKEFLDILEIRNHVKSVFAGYATDNSPNRAELKEKFGFDDDRLDEMEEHLPDLGSEEEEVQVRFLKQTQEFVNKDMKERGPFEEEETTHIRDNSILEVLKDQNRVEVIQ